jgi:endogenous inhibitor of DNA gyrase (YacG/DUF329 family)
MKLDDKYPHAEPDGFEVYGDDYVKTGETKDCIYCFNRTNWMSITTKSPICSEECDEIIWEHWADHTLPSTSLYLEDEW